jgi:hypothetical protein
MFFFHIIIFFKYMFSHNIVVPYFLMLFILRVLLLHCLIVFLLFMLVACITPHVSHFIGQKKSFFGNFTFKK